VVLYEAVTGQRPFDGPSPAAVALERLRVRPAPPSAVAHDLDREIDRLILHAMEQEPTDRYPSAGDFAAALERWRVASVGGVRRQGGTARAGAGPIASRAAARAAAAGAVVTRRTALGRAGRAAAGQPIHDVTGHRSAHEDSAADGHGIAAVDLAGPAALGAAGLAGATGAAGAAAAGSQGGAASSGPRPVAGGEVGRAAASRGGAPGEDRAGEPTGAGPSEASSGPTAPAPVPRVPPVPLLRSVRATRAGPSGSRAAATAGAATVAAGGTADTATGPAGAPPVPPVDPAADAGATTPTPEPVPAGRPIARRPPPDDRRRRRTPVALFLPLIALGILGLVGAIVLSGAGRDQGGVAGATGTPGASDLAIAPGTEASPSVAPSPTPSAEPSPTPTPTPTPTPEPTPTPTPEPTPTPTPRPEPTPTPQPTPRPTPPPDDGLPDRDPAETVARFYRLVVRERFDDAAALWTAEMRQRYPPREYIDGRFNDTTEIEMRRNEIIAFDPDAGTATVAVDIVEYEPGASTRFIGDWDLLLVDGRWLLNDPDF
jgi:hypothetical protein